MKTPRTILFLLALASGPLFAAEKSMVDTKTAPAATWHFLTADAVQLKSLLPLPPATGSPAADADLETVLEVQTNRTPEQIFVAKMFEQDDVFKFSSIVGPWFSADHLPGTAAFFQFVLSDTTLASREAKVLFNRLRPPQMDSRVHPCVEVPTSSSYPSGHSTRAWMWATLLGEIFPEHREALLERARLIAWSRVIGGVHFPSDIMAGKILGRKIAEELLKTPAVQEAIKKSQVEAQPFLLKKAA